MTDNRLIEARAIAKASLDTAIIDVLAAAPRGEDFRSPTEFHTAEQGHLSLIATLMEGRQRLVEMMKGRDVLQLTCSIAPVAVYQTRN